ncbi:hypothetical protein B0I35DRAFT_238708 [Stachybotrys elegans]|uniref:Uncharacterized protein n=1 Tax=Stachybotrys elegans TaxID=80388 RepID=A0A8K0WQE3_9HYPO|nr:hypothetical protein B0I35DRAFT_238708 [Stachybotrys elegans]
MQGRRIGLATLMRGCRRLARRRMISDASQIHSPFASSLVSADAARRVRLVDLPAVQASSLAVGHLLHEDFRAILGKGVAPVQDSVDALRGRPGIFARTGLTQLTDEGAKKDLVQLHLHCVIHLVPGGVIGDEVGVVGSVSRVVDVGVLTQPVEELHHLRRDAEAVATDGVCGFGGGRLAVVPGAADDARVKTEDGDALVRATAPRTALLMPAWFGGDGLDDKVVGSGARTLPEEGNLGRQKRDEGIPQVLPEAHLFRLDFHSRRLFHCLQWVSPKRQEELCMVTRRRSEACWMVGRILKDKTKTDCKVICLYIRVEAR